MKKLLSVFLSVLMVAELAACGNTKQDVTTEEVELTYTKIDDYNNMIGMVLNGNDAPDIYVNYSWMYGRDQYSSSIEHAEDLSDPALGLDLGCIRSNIILNTDDGSLPMVPIFSNTYGMLVNNDLFEKEGLEVPTTYTELVEVCEAFRAKGYESPLMGFTQEETTSLYTVSIYPYYCSTVADDPDAVAALNSLDSSSNEQLHFAFFVSLLYDSNLQPF